MMNTFSCPFFWSFFLMFTFNHFFGFPWCSGCFGLICGLVLLLSFKVWSYCEKREPRARSPSVWHKNPFEFVARLCLLLGVTAYFAKPTWVQNLIETCNCSRPGLALSVFSALLDTKPQELGRSGFSANLGNWSWWEFCGELQFSLSRMNYQVSTFFWPLQVNIWFLVTQTAVPSHRGLPGFPVSYQQWKCVVQGFTENVPSKGKTSLLNGTTRRGSF